MRAAVICVVFALVWTVSTMALAAPTVTMETDRTDYQSGDTIEVTLSVWKPEGATTLDFCVGLLMFDGSIVTLGPDGWVPGIVCWNSDMRIPAQFDMTAHFRFQVPSVQPAPPINQDGEYYFASLCLAPGTWSWASNLGLAPFSYGSAGPSIPMVSIPAGSFVMGSSSEESGSVYHERPQRTVNISALQMSETEVTQRQWADIMGWDDSGFSGDDHPVEHVNWFDCVSFCNKLSQANGYAQCYTMTNMTYNNNHIASADVSCDFDANGYRLPTEAEWEYACRAGTTTRFYTGDLNSDLGRAGWWGDNAGLTTHTVGEKEPNAWGLYDMHGNVEEWCWDWYSSSYYGTRPDPDSDPTGPTSGDDRLVRGGNESNLPQHCRSAHRWVYYPSYHYCNAGFRLARSSN